MHSAWSVGGRDVIDALQVAAPLQAPAVVAAHEALRSVLPSSPESVVEVLRRLTTPLPHPTLPSGPLAARHEVAGQFWQSLIVWNGPAVHGTTDEAPGIRQLRHVAPLQALCRSQLDKLVETGLAGIGLTEALSRLFVSDPDAIARSRSRVQHAVDMVARTHST